MKQLCRPTLRTLNTALHYTLSSRRLGDYTACGSLCCSPSRVLCRCLRHVQRIWLIRKISNPCRYCMVEIIFLGSDTNAFLDLNQIHVQFNADKA